MPKIRGCLVSVIIVLCVVMCMPSVCASEVTQQQEIYAKQICDAYNAMPSIRAQNDYTDAELASIKYFLGLWESADEQVLAYVNMEYGIWQRDYTVYSAEYQETVGLSASGYDISNCSIEELPDVVYSGSAQKPKPIVKYVGEVLIEKDDYKLSYKNNKNAGVATVTVIGIGRFSGRTELTFSILKKSISETVLAPLSSKTYTGKRIKHKVKFYDENKRLKQGTDYTLLYADNKNVGTASVVIKGKGNYNGSRIATFKITKRNLRNAKIFGIKTYIRSGDVIVPEIKVTKNGKTLRKGIDYNVSCFNNQQVGNATVRITGTGNYSGTVVRYFKIVPPRVRNVKGVGKSGSRLSWGEVESASGYVVRYATKADMKSAKKVVVKKAYDVRIKNLKGKYVQVRAYQVVKGTRFYGKYSKVKKV